MDYKKGSEVLPAHLLKEVQKYIDGGLLYIPKSTRKISWGNLSGTRNKLKIRNENIQKLFRQNYSIYELSKKFFLSEKNIKKIVYCKKQL